MKLYGFEPFWQLTAADMGELTREKAALAAVSQLHPCTGEPTALFLGRGLAARGEDVCPLLVLRARICLDDGAPRIAPAADAYRLCVQTLRCTFGVDQDILYNMQAMLEQTPSADALPVLLEIWSRLLHGYCTVQPGEAVLLAARRAYLPPEAASQPPCSGALRLSGWARLAAEHAAEGSRILLTARSRDRLRALRAALPDDLPALGSWEDADRVKAFAAQILDDAEQADELSAQADSAAQQAIALEEQLHSVRQAIDGFHADWQPADADEQTRLDRLLPDEIPAGVPFPLDEAQLTLLRSLPGAEQPPEPEDAVEQLCMQWNDCCAQYAADPVRIGGQPACLSAGGLTLGSGSVALDRDALALLTQLDRMHDALEWETWLYDALVCKNEAQLSLYQTLADALAAAARCQRSGGLNGRRVEYKGAPAKRGKALQALRELESKCAAWEAEEPYTFSDFIIWHTIRAAYKAHCTLVDGALPRTQEDCRAARAALELQQCMRDVQAAWQPLCGAFRHTAEDCGALELLLRLCLACNARGLHLHADELPLPQAAAGCIARAEELAQQHEALCQALAQQQAQPGVLDAVRTLDLAAYRKECARAAQDARRQALRTRAAVVEIVRRHAPLWAARLETEACPPDDMRAIWEEKSARAGQAGGIGRLLAREQALYQDHRSAQGRAWSLRARVSAAHRASADPLILALLTRAARGAADAAACAVCAPVFLSDSAQASGFDLVIADRSGMNGQQLACLPACADQALVFDVLPDCTPELRLVSADGAMGFCRPAERLIQGQLSARMCRIWWQPSDQESAAADPISLVRQELDGGNTVAVVCPAPEEMCARLAESLPASLLCTGSLYCGDAAVLTARQFDAVILCPGLSHEQLAAAARASLDAGTLWVLGADRYGADWGRSLLLGAWQDQQPACAAAGQADTISRVLAEMYGWEAVARPGGLELCTPAGPLWLALLAHNGAYPLPASERAALYEAGWTLDGLSLPEYQANPRQVLQRLAAYGGATAS